MRTKLRSSPPFESSVVRHKIGSIAIQTQRLFLDNRGIGLDHVGRRSLITTSFRLSLRRFAYHYVVTSLFLRRDCPPTHNNMAQANALAVPMVPPIPPPRPLNYVDHYDRMIDVFNGTYSSFLAKFGPESDDQPAALRDSVLAAENNIPKVFGVFQSDPTPRVSFIHRPTKFAPSLTGATTWDNEIFGFLGDLQAGNQVNLIKWPEDSFRRTIMLRVPNVDTMDAMWAAADANTVMLGPFAGNAPNTSEIRARFLCPIPQRYVRLGLSRHMTPRIFWTDIVGQVIADGAQNDCSVLVNFGRMICTYGPTAANGGRTYPMNKPLVSPVPDQVLGDRKWQWVTLDLPALLGRDHTSFEAAVLQQTAVFHQAFQQQHTDAAAERAAARAPPRPFPMSFLKLLHKSIACVVPLWMPICLPSTTPWPISSVKMPLPRCPVLLTLVPASRTPPLCRP